MTKGASEIARGNLDQESLRNEKNGWLSVTGIRPIGRRPSDFMASDQNNRGSHHIGYEDMVIAKTDFSWLANICLLRKLHICSFAVMLETMVAIAVMMMAGRMGFCTRLMPAAAYGD